MNSYYILVLLMTLSAAFAYINHRYIKMPFVIGLFFLSTMLSLVVLSGKLWNIEQYAAIKTYVLHTNISKFILDILLGFLLFAGSMHTHWQSIKNQIFSIGLFAVFGVLLSTIIIAVLLFYCCQLFSVSIDFMYCLIFGALISPTDPIAVLGILTKANVPKKIEATIVGESLFNDGVGVVVFIALLETLNMGTGKIDFTHFGILFLKEAVGGVIFGLALGFILHQLIKSIDNYETEVLLTIAFVMAGYAGANYLHLSGPLAMVIMGLFVGNYRTNKAMNDITKAYMHKFWELVDVILNAILFIIIAFVLVIVDINTTYLIISLICILIVLLSRFLVIYLPNLFLKKYTNISNKEAKFVVWGGLRGGLSLALVLSIPENPSKQLLILATYICVVFSIMVQGLTVERFAKKIVTDSDE